MILQYLPYMTNMPLSANYILQCKFLCTKVDTKVYVVIMFSANSLVQIPDKLYSAKFEVIIFQCIFLGCHKMTLSANSYQENNTKNHLVQIPNIEMHSANSLLKVSAYSMLLNLQDKFLEMSQCNFHGQVLGFSAKSIVQSNYNIQCKVCNYKNLYLVQIPSVKSSSVKCELLS